METCSVILLPAGPWISNATPLNNNLTFPRLQVISAIKWLDPEMQVPLEISNPPPAGTPLVTLHRGGALPPARPCLLHKVPTFKGSFVTKLSLQTWDYEMCDLSIYIWLNFGNICQLMKNLYILFNLLHVLTLQKLLYPVGFNVQISKSTIYQRRSNLNVLQNLS